ncbi:signal peptidase II [Isoptericola jiangsuensis]|uniref:Lipoprotein signal peptidase n=1 Tax=Isoptericola jiangsuensis TaxID=548579 RepID=A0A2A9EX61_9MICO|nr:signal peptidase II [Isoptericola jiangsuensis]PFG42860.1 signal peptidase II [Isoptericola jiangsuensis]
MSTTPAGADPVPETPDEPVLETTSPDDTAAARHRRRLATWAWALAAAVLVVDQLTKWWALSALTVGERIDLLGDLLGLTLVFNDGAALSIGGGGYTWALTIVVVAVVVVIVRAMRRIGSRGWALSLGLLLGGALGNLADRFFREPGFARGEVVDMIAYANFFVGNVADIAIVVAAGMIIVLSFRGIGLDGSRQGEDVR